MTDDTRYYADRYRYALRQAEKSDDPSIKAIHLVMAARYQELAMLDGPVAEPLP